MASQKKDGESDCDDIFHLISNWKFRKT
ncbi:uncharacterized protein METZ01_LOCUS476113 [marine metagenome]|uniref:Uncharacterized protein n=1 Tax=marine metagenome TaxID=408172 RepID=A0A383BTQ6_9ZZZZ